MAQSLENTGFYGRKQEKSRLLSSQRKKQVLRWFVSILLANISVIIICLRSKDHTERGKTSLCGLFLSGGMLMKLTRPFAMVEKDVLFSPELTALEKLVYCVLCAFSDNNTRSCYPSYNTIAEKVGCSKKTAIQCVASLCEKGWMQKMEQRTKKGGHRSNLYILVLSPEKQ